MSAGALGNLTGRIHHPVPGQFGACWQLAQHPSDKAGASGQACQGRYLSIAGHLTLGDAGHNLPDGLFPAWTILQLTYRRRIPIDSRPTRSL